MRTFSLYLLLALVWFNQNANCQTLVIESIYKNQIIYLRSGAKVWVQTKDDPEATYTEANFVSFDGTNMHFSKGYGKRKKEISVPLQHISNMYISNGLRRYFGKTILYGLGYGFFVGGIAMMAEYPPAGSLFLVGSFPLFMQAIVLPTRKRIYVPNYDIYYTK
jgi:hypothetical protein